MISEQDIHVEYVVNHEINDHSLICYLKKPTFNPKICFYLQVSCLFIYPSCSLSLSFRLPGGRAIVFFVYHGISMAGLKGNIK